jgi:hypothetical protein
MTRNSGIGLMVCALVFVALAGPGHAAEAILGANAAIQGEGRFYRATENMILEVGPARHGLSDPRAWRPWNPRPPWVGER